MLLVAVLEPDLGRSAAFDDEIDLLEHVSLGVQGAGGRNLDGITAPLALGTVELDIAASAADALPGFERQVANVAHAELAVDRNPFGLHELIVRCSQFPELAETGLLAFLWLYPMLVTHLRLRRFRAAAIRFARSSGKQNAGKEAIR